MSKHTAEMQHDHVSLQHVRDDGFRCVHTLDYNQSTELYYQLREIHLTTLGMQKMTVHVSQLEPGDVIDSFGFKVKKVKHFTSRDEWVVTFEGDHITSPRRLVLGEAVEISVNRIIQ